MKIVSVRLGDRSYKIFIAVPLKSLGADLKRTLSHKLGPPKRALIVTQPFSKKNAAGKMVEQSLARAGIQPIFAVIPEGEKSKNLKTVQNLYQKCLEAKLDRSSCIIAFGGGVVGDIAGFVAATYLRGIPFVQAPTTLLAMVDSSIGGKVGVDLPESKNSVGCFYQPQLVWIDLTLLESLPEAEFRNGFAEVIKYGVIADAKLFELLEKNSFSLLAPRSSLLAEVMARCIQIKAAVVSKDEKETRGLREILNFGHTFGHAIETATAYRSYSHGEAISIGMCAAGFISEKARLWSGEERNRMEKLIAGAGLPIRLKKVLSGTEIISTLMRDKKMRGNQLRFVLPTKIGKVIVKEISPELAQLGFQYIQPSALR